MAVDKAAQDLTYHRQGQRLGLKRMVVSKALWRDIRVMEQVDGQVAIDAFMALLPGLDMES